MALQTRSSSPAPPYPWASGSVAAPGASQKKRKHDPSSPATSPGSGVAAAPAAPNPPQKKRKHDLSFLVASPGSGVAAAPAAPNPLQKKNKREVSLPSAALRNPALAPGLIERDFCFSCLWRLGQDFAHKCEFRSTGASCDSCNSKRRGCKAVSTSPRVASGTVPLIVVQIPTSFFSLTNYCIAQARFAADGSLSPTPRFIKSELLSLHRVCTFFFPLGFRG